MEGNRPRAVTLLGAVKALRRSSGTGLQDVVDVVEGRMVAGHLTPQDQPYLAAGEAMTLDEAVRYALEPAPSEQDAKGAEALLQ